MQGILSVPSFLCKFRFSNSALLRHLKLSSCASLVWPAQAIIAGCRRRQNQHLARLAGRRHQIHNIGGIGPPAFPEIAGHAPDLARARRDGKMITLAMAELRKLVPNPGS